MKEKGKRFLGIGSILVVGFVMDSIDTKGRCADFGSKWD